MKSALIIGGCKGIGRAISERLAQDGFDIIATCRKPGPDSDETAQLVQNHQRTFTVLPLDVTEAEAAIFDAAVKDYPMIHAQATTVGSRTLPNGTEYLFTAVDQPRPGAPEGMAPREMTVYVTAIEGEAPVFTQVAR